MTNRPRARIAALVIGAVIATGALTGASFVAETTTSPTTRSAATLGTSSAAYLTATTGTASTAATGSATAAATVAVSDGTRPLGTPTRSVRRVAMSAVVMAGGLWRTIAWPKATTVNRIVLVAGPNASTVPAQTVAVFSDGSSVMLTPNSAGDVDVSIPPRSVTAVTFSVVASSAIGSTVELDSYSVDNTGVALSTDAGTPISSSGTAAALADGDIAGGSTGQTWTSDPADTAPWAGISYTSPETLGAVQLFGPPAGGALSSGTLLFSDGSTVFVSGVDGDGGQPTLIAFTPRTISWVMYSPSTGGQRSLREFVAYPAGVTPATYPAGVGASAGFATPTVAASGCSATSTAVGVAPARGIGLVCPAVDATVSGMTTVVVAAPVGSSITATAWIPTGPTDSNGHLGIIATATAGSNGRAVLRFNANALTNGPTAIKATIKGNTTSNGTVYVQLVNAGGVTQTSAPTAPAGMTLDYQDNFTSPISVSRLGTNATYGGVQPQPGGGGEFGASVFADPAWGDNTITTATTGSTGNLRIRNQPLTSRTDPYNWGRTSESGLISSMHTNGAGILTQYGYYEIRALGAPGTGSWPAFWTLDSRIGTVSKANGSEVDVTELFGQDTTGQCSTTHWWEPSGGSTGTASCQAHPSANGIADNWALRWHSYAVRIGPNSTQYYLDGQLIASHTIRTTDAPNFFLIDEALGGGWPVALGQTGGITDFNISRVSVWS